jgi:hypothetical protein
VLYFPATLVPDTNTIRIVAYLNMLASSLSNKTPTYVAPARIKSVVFDLVRMENTTRNDIVEIMTTKMRIDVVFVTLQITTGSRSRSVIRSNSNILATRRIKDPE